ncbi:unnamed protein product, partial [Acanthoscelides obtectus]
VGSCGDCAATAAAAAAAAACSRPPCTATAVELPPPTPRPLPGPPPVLPPPLFSGLNNRTMYKGGSMMMSFHMPKQNASIRIDNYIFLFPNDLIRSTIFVFSSEICDVDRKNRQIRTISLFQFKVRRKAAETARDINDAFVKGTTNEREHTECQD